jgi:HK97 family phage major capsid protein
MGKINDLKGEKVKALKEARAKAEEAQKEDRQLTAEESEFIDKAMTDYDEWEAKAQAEEKEEKLRKLTDAAEENDRKAEQKVERPQGVTGDVVPETKESKQQQVLRLGTEGDAYAKAFGDYIRGDDSAKTFLMQVKADGAEGAGATGGYLVPKLLDNQLWTDLAAEAPMVNLVTTRDISGYQLDVSQNYSHGAAAWTAEAAGYNTGDEAFTQVTITAYKATRITKESEEVLADSKFPLESVLSESFSRAFAAILNTALTVGTGSSQPNGIVPKITSGQTVTGATGTTVTIPADNVFDLEAKVRSVYRNDRAVFMGSDAARKTVRLLKDSTLQYIWQPGMQAGIPDRLLGYRFELNPDVAVPAANAYSLVFGRLEGHMMVRPAGGITIQRLNELYAANGQVGFRGYIRAGADFVGPADSVARYRNSAT